MVEGRSVVDSVVYWGRVEDGSCMNNGFSDNDRFGNGFVDGDGSRGSFVDGSRGGVSNRCVFGINCFSFVFHISDIAVRASTIGYNLNTTVGKVYTVFSSSI